ncbi:MAG: hypothetical protein ACPGXL_07755 [Chitinophagales bacterium]
MDKQIHPDKLFEHIRQLPVELSFEQIEQFVLAQPIGATTVWHDWKLWFNLKNSIFMTGFMIGIGLITSLFFTTDTSLETNKQQQISKLVETTKPLNQACCGQEFLELQNYPKNLPAYTSVPLLKEQTRDFSANDEVTEIALNKAIASTVLKTQRKKNSATTTIYQDRKASNVVQKTTTQKSPTLPTTTDIVSAPMATVFEKSDDKSKQKNIVTTPEMNTSNPLSEETNTNITDTHKTNSSTNSELPKGWYRTSCKSNHFKVGMDAQESKTGTTSAFIEAIPNEEGTYYSENLQQKIDASPYLGKRILLKGFIKTDLQGQNSYATMKIRTTNKKNNKVLTYDYMVYRRIRGNTEWQAYEIVLNVPKRAGNIIYGAGMRGKGKMWMDDFQISVVDRNTLLTKKDQGPTRDALNQPTNTNFEENK